MAERRAHERGSEAAWTAGQRRLYKVVDSTLLEYGSLEPRQEAIMALAKENHINKEKLKELVHLARENHPQINAIARVRKLVEDAKNSGKEPDLSMFRRLQPAAKSAGKDDLWLGEQLGYIPKFLEEAAIEKKEGKQKTSVAPMVAGVLLLILAGGAFIWWQTYGSLMLEDMQQANLDDSSWQEALSQSDLQSFQAYLQSFPAGQYAGEARLIIADMDERAWEEATRLNTREALQSYIDQFNTHLNEARKLMDGYLTQDVFRDCFGCPEMTVVSSGRFVMGSETGDPEEMPVHEVSIEKAFAVSTFEVTFAEWDVCALKNACAKDIFDSNFGRENRPVINVSWQDAQSYIEWLSAETGDTYRFLTEAEWEYSARGGTTGDFWWGNSFQLNREICNGCSQEFVLTGTAEVGSLSANPFGLHDMTGNVAEWVMDCRHTDYSGAPTDSSEWLAGDDGDCSQRVIRGGSWYAEPDQLRVSFRSFAEAGYRDLSTGFRVAKEL